MSPPVPTSPSCGGWGCVRGSVPACGSFSQNCLVARCFEENGQELQQLEGQVAQLKVSSRSHGPVRGWKGPLEMI